MKLFLSSLAITYDQSPAFTKLVGKPANEINIALIENAADCETGDKAWVAENRAAMQALGFQIKPIDLEDFRDGGGESSLLEALSFCDVIWLGGGNTYYLRWILSETKADAVIQELVRGGKVYGGGSAGAIVAGPTLKHFEIADDPKAAPEPIYEGLSLTNTVVVPHSQNKKFGPIVVEIADKLEYDGFSVQLITDQQAFVMDGNIHSVI